MRLALPFVLAAGPLMAGSEVLMEAEPLIACMETEPEVTACVPEPICDPSWAYFHREACAKAAVQALETAMAHFGGQLAALTEALDARMPGRGFALAEKQATIAWTAYRDANCAPDRTTDFNMMSENEARGYCRIGHTLRRIAVIRNDLDRFEFMLAASE